MIDTGEIWYHMQSSVSHLPLAEQKKALLDAAFNLLARASMEEDDDE